MGDFYTMGPEDALQAAKWLGAKNYMPIHYNTFPLLQQDPQQFKQQVEAACDAACHILQPGEALEI